MTPTMPHPPASRVRDDRGYTSKGQDVGVKRFSIKSSEEGIRPSTPALAAHGPPMTKRVKFKFLSLQPYISYIDQATYSLFVCALK